MTHVKLIIHNYISGNILLIYHIRYILSPLIYLFISWDTIILLLKNYKLFLLDDTMTSFRVYIPFNALKEKKNLWYTVIPLEKKRTKGQTKQFSITACAAALANASRPRDFLALFREPQPRWSPPIKVRARALLPSRG